MLAKAVYTARGYTIILLIIAACAAPLQQCPSKCECRNRLVKCVDKQLTTIPHFDGSLSVHLLDISYNNITTLRNNSFREFPNVKGISVSNSEVVWLETNTFQGLTQLEKIDLSNNFIGYIHPNTFTSNTNLHTLILNYNLLEEIDLDSSSITTLDVSHCEIRHLTHVSLSAMPALQSVDLSHNRLTHLSEYTFIGLTHITTIGLSYNAWTCNTNFDNAMCWVQSRSQKLISETCYDSQQQRVLWRDHTCMSIVEVVTSTEDPETSEQTEKLDFISTTDQIQPEEDEESFIKLLTAVAMIVLIVMLLISTVALGYTVYIVRKQKSAGFYNKNMKPSDNNDDTKPKETNPLIPNTNINHNDINSLTPTSNEIRGPFQQRRTSRTENIYEQID